MSQTNVKSLLDPHMKKWKKVGSISFDMIFGAIPDEVIDANLLESVYNVLEKAGIKVVETKLSVICPVLSINTRKNLLSFI